MSTGRDPPLPLGPFGRTLTRVVGVVGLRRLCVLAFPVELYH